LSRQLVTDHSRAITAKGEFRVPATSVKNFGWRELEVQWRPVIGGGG
jgi:hypothetical protein